MPSSLAQENQAMTHTSLGGAGIDSNGLCVKWLQYTTLHVGGLP